MELLSLLLLPLMTICLACAEPHDCSEVEYDSGLPSQIYSIYPVHFGSAVKVYCEMDTDKKHWTVFMRRQDGILNFNRNWTSYRNGFGDPVGEHWLGLENLYQLTKDGSYQLQVLLEDFEGNSAYTQYDLFYIDAEFDGYALHVSGFRDGEVGDSLSWHDGQKFSTYDNDQDSSKSNCAQRFFGGFWYNACYHTNPTGIYQWQPVRKYLPNGIIWSHWRGFLYSLKGITIMFRPSS